MTGVPEHAIKERDPQREKVTGIPLHILGPYAYS
jgi:hypothetical protein